ncbi:Threonine aldolase [Tulasnella sp. 331]|nr:Threonine aldolase [Tulasnella sp. 331]
MLRLRSRLAAHGSTSLTYTINRPTPSSISKPRHSMASTPVNGIARPAEAPKTPAAFDFRSDTITTPTESMLQSMTQSTLGDAVFDEDETTASFEAHVAQLLGHEKGLFVPSGTAGNQVAMRTHLTSPPHSVLCDYRSHLVTSEAGGLATLSQAMAQSVRPSNGIYLTVDDVKREAILEENIHYAPTRVIALENTLGGTILPLQEVARIREYATANGLKVHLDGARLWNACAAGAGSLYDYGKHFDSVTVCFSKGLGAPVGSVLVGSSTFIQKAKWIRKSIGGGMRQTGTLTNAAWTALREVYPKLAATHEVTKDLEQHFRSLGITTKLPVETNMIFMDLERAGLKNAWLTEEAKKHGDAVTIGVAHHAAQVHVRDPNSREPE